MADFFSMPCLFAVAAVVVVASLFTSLLPRLSSLARFQKRVGITEISTRSFPRHENNVRLTERDRRSNSLRKQVSEDTIDCSLSSRPQLPSLSLLPLLANRRPLPSSTRTATAPSRRKSSAPSCARWARTRRRRSCRCVSFAEREVTTKKKKRSRFAPLQPLLSLSHSTLPSLSRKPPPPTPGNGQGGRR